MGNSDDRKFQRSYGAVKYQVVNAYRFDAILPLTMFHAVLWERGVTSGFLLEP